MEKEIVVRVIRLMNDLELNNWIRFESLEQHIELTQVVVNNMIAAIKINTSVIADMEDKFIPVEPSELESMLYFLEVVKSKNSVSDAIEYFGYESPLWVVNGEIQ